jgi:undecaprenyl-diphosphatase
MRVCHCPVSAAKPSRAANVFVCILLAVTAASAMAAGGPLGIDHRLGYDNSGVWKRSNQTALLELMVGAELAGGLWEGGQTRLGRTFWQSIDASAIAGLSSQVLKRTFTRARPSQTDNPDLWFQGGSHYSFPSGEVTAVSAIVTPFVLEYRHDEPAVYALELLPIYDAVARVKVRGHWQSDVLASLALGTAIGYYAHSRKSPLILSVLPHGFFIGLRAHW